MREYVLHHIWWHSHYPTNSLHTTKGEPVEVLFSGQPNNGSGPDFLNARVRIGTTEWAGNVEIHVKSSDWTLHKHHTDTAYNTVILHVVYEHNAEAYCQNGELLPTLVIPCNHELEQKYQQLSQSTLRIPCRHTLPHIDEFRMRHFLSRLLVERLQRKSDDITEALGKSMNNWREAFYQLLFRSFGFGNNALPFEQLSQATPLRVVEKYCTNVFQTEALLFGQAGFLHREPTDDYQAKLKAEYTFLQATYNLTPIDNTLWKFGRLRPANYPTVRIAQLSKLVSKFGSLLDAVLTYTTYKDFLTVTNVEVSAYWTAHYTFGKQSNKQTKTLGVKSAERLITNAIIPFMFTYGKAKNNDALQDTAMKLLEALPAESNSIIDNWTEAGFKPDNAFYSQALLQLTTNYCNKRLCLACAIGTIILHNRQ